jgi:DNA-binding NtrC family response regulator
VQILDPPEQSWARVRWLRANLPAARIVALSNNGSERTAVEAFRCGVHDYLTAPLCRETVRETLARVLGDAPRNGSALVGVSVQAARVREEIRRLAAADCNVLITGETGTGKELAAQEIHSCSARADYPLVSVNCAAIPEALLESELFGFDRGAFTGAYRPLMGQLEAADKGAILLDEIGDLPPAGQAKLLRAIENKEVRRLGSRTSIRVDLRVIAATSRDLEQMIENSRFRADLYFRLNIGRIHLPPLRERPGDIRALAEHFIGELNRDYGCFVEAVEESLLEQMERYSWPGNIRELRNVLESSFVTRPGSKITYHELPEWFRGKLTLQPAGGCEADRLLAALRACNWNKTKAAEQLNWSRMTVYRKMEQYNLTRPKARAASGE